MVWVEVGEERREGGNHVVSCHVCVVIKIGQRSKFQSVTLSFSSFVTELPPLTQQVVLVAGTSARVECLDAGVFHASSRHCTRFHVEAFFLLVF